jgi:hypothetical protein
MPKPVPIGMTCSSASVPLGSGIPQFQSTRLPLHRLCIPQYRFPKPNNLCCWRISVSIFRERWAAGEQRTVAMCCTAANYLRWLSWLHLLHPVSIQASRCDVPELHTYCPWMATSKHLKSYHDSTLARGLHKSGHHVPVSHSTPSNFRQMQ